MRRVINIAALLLAFACATAPLSHRERLQVVTDVTTYHQQVRADPDKRLVDLGELGLPLEIRYATGQNFMKRVLYPEARAFLRAPAAQALLRVQRELAPLGLGVKVWDAYRPYSVTEAMWEPIRNPDYVADPAKGSRHNRGAAVDLTLVSLETGSEIPMPTPYDDFTPAAAHAYEQLPDDVKANRALLRDLMIKHGFEPLPSEWWHYDFRGWERYELLDLPFGAL